MSRLQTYGDYAREIARVEQLIAQTTPRAEASAAAGLARRSLERRLESLRTEVARLNDDAVPGQELDVVIEGRPVLGHAIETEFMGRVLLQLQHLVRSVAASQGPQSANAGPLPSAVRRASTLHFASAFPGSFGMRLEAIQEQLELNEFPPLAPTFREVFALLHVEGDGSEVVARLAELGPRARATYRDLLDEFGKAGADVRVDWPGFGGVQTVRVRATQARRMLDTMSRLRVHVDGRYYTGLLDQASRRRGRFGFESDEGETFDGVVESEIVDTLREFYDRRCRAYILTREVEHPGTGVRKRSHRLQELLPVDVEGTRAEGAVAEPQEFDPAAPAA